MLLVLRRTYHMHVSRTRCGGGGMRRLDGRLDGSGSARTSSVLGTSPDDPRQGPEDPRQHALSSGSQGCSPNFQLNRSFWQSRLTNFFACGADVLIWIFDEGVAASLVALRRAETSRH